jgi:2'-5' RNA ligase
VSVTLARPDGGIQVVNPLEPVDDAAIDGSDWIAPYLDDLKRWDWGWVRARYIRTGLPANRNGHIFDDEDIVDAHRLVRHTPFNMVHTQRHVIGTNIAVARLEPPPGAAMVAGTPDTPWVETLSNVWRHVFGIEWRAIKDAADKGVASVSMECWPETVKCGTCEASYPYDGITSETYTCGHLDDRRAPKWLRRPHFVGNAAVVPPARPGWKDAAIQQVAALEYANPEEAEQIYRQVAASFARLAPADWEWAMGLVLQSAGYDAPMPPKKRHPMRTDGPAPTPAAAAPVSTGAMIAIYPPAAVAEELAQFGTEPVEQLHVTVCYLGKADELAYTALDVAAAIDPVTQLTAPLTAKVSGIGRFDIGDGQEATYASIDSVGLSELYTRIAAALEGAGLTFARNHGYTAHLTLAYAPAGEGPNTMPPAISWTVADIHVVWKDQHIVVPFAGQANQP